MSAQELINKWGRKKYGQKYGMDKTYTIDISSGYTYCSTLTGGDSYMEMTVYADGKEVDQITNFDFTDLLNEMLDT